MGDLYNKNRTYFECYRGVNTYDYNKKLSIIVTGAC